MKKAAASLPPQTAQGSKHIGWRTLGPGNESKLRPFDLFDMEAKLATAFRIIREQATLVLARQVDPIVAARTIDAQATSIGIGLKEPFLTLKGIVSQADEIPDPEQLQYWDPAIAADKRQERIEFLGVFGEQILSLCWEVQSYVAGHMK